MGVWRWGLAGRLSFLPYELGWGLMLHCGFLPSWMATTSVYDLYRFAIWSSSCGHIVQSIQSFCGGFITSICLLFDQSVFWWCSLDRPQIVPGIRSESFADSQHPFGYTIFRGEMSEDAEYRHIFGPGSWLQSSPFEGSGSVLGPWTHRDQAASSHANCRGIRQTATRGGSQALRYRQLLWAWRVGAYWLRWLGPNQAQTAGALFRVNWGVAPELWPATHCHHHPSLSPHWDLATCRAPLPRCIGCCVGEPRSGDWGLFGGVAWRSQATPGGICFSHSPIGVQPMEPGDKKIAQLELLQVLYALFSRPARFRGRRGLWFIDNTAALMALIRGRSDNADLEHMSRLIHITLFGLKAWFFWEWIPSKANWSDEISREGLQATWHKRHGFTTHFAFFPFEIWSLPLPAFLRVVEFLWVLWDEVHWERFNLCSLLSLQERGTGCTDPTSAAVQETTCTAFPKHYPARSRLRPHEEFGKKKPCGCEPGHSEPFKCICFTSHN